jgi:hypothetical protein
MATTSSKISPVGTNNYKTDVTTNTDGSLTSTTFRVDPTGANPVAVSTLNTKKDGTSTRKSEPGATDAEQKAFNNKDSTEIKEVNKQIIDAKPYGTNPTAEQQKQLNAAAGKQNQATNPEGGTTDQGASPTAKLEDKEAFNKENSKYRSGTREKYDDNLVYPLNLKSELQDVIKFTILKYSPSLAKDNQSSTQFGSGKSRVVTLESGIPIVKGSTSIGSIILPIPAGISDGNTVGWNNDELSALQGELSNLTQGFFDEGIAGAGGAISNTVGKTEESIKSGELRTSVKAAFGSIAASGANIAGRAFGVAFNNNLELLFSSPSLRSFNFTFSFYPRGKDEAIRVRKIIRTFKQSMSVKRSDTSLLLKAPHTFAISYVTAGQKAQPYLNRFKECALTSCSVDYTPDGTYMTYGGDEKSMTAYRLSLQFQELEPIFDDEYGQDYDNVGF